MTGMLSSIERTAAQVLELRQSRKKTEATGDQIDAYMAARAADIAQIKPAEDFRESLKEEFHGTDPAHHGLYLPWGKVADKWRIRSGELTIWSGFNGHRKSMLTGFVLLDLIRQGQKGCILSFEMKPRKTLRRMASQAIGSSQPTIAYIDKFMDSMAGKLWLYDQQGQVTADRVIAVITYCAEQLGITQFLVDSMMKIVEDEDDYNGQKKLTGRLQNLARDLDVHIHLITHAKKKEDESKRPGKQDNRGSGTIVDQTDNFVVVFKLPGEKEGDAADFCLYVDKQRNSADGWEGSLALWFDPQSLQFLDGKWEKARLYV
jgi:twinkle protein